MRELGSLVDPSGWATLGLSGMLPTLVSLDDERRVVGPAFTWEDGRSEPQAERIVEQVGAGVLYRKTGQRLDGRYLLPMYARRAGEVPTLRYALGAKDYLLWWLTGAWATDPSTAAGYGCWDLRAERWDPAIAACAESPILPEVVPSSKPYPLLAARAERWGCTPGIPVVVGGADSVMAADSLGITEPGRIGIISGTSTVIIGWSPSLRFDPESRYLVTPLVGDGVGLELDLISTGSALVWMAEIFGLPGGAAELVELAETAALDESPIVLPYLGPGEQGALWDPRLIGLIQGITTSTTRAQLARGLVAGIVLETARCVAVLREAQGDLVANILHVTGASGSSGLFRQDLADATGLIVRHDPGEHDHSALGAALFAGRSALDWLEVGPLVQGEEVLADPAHAQRWSERLVRHESARSALRVRLPR
jgi:xylulokinase